MRAAHKLFCILNPYKEPVKNNKKTNHHRAALQDGNYSYPEMCQGINGALVKILHSSAQKAGLHNHAGSVATMPFSACCLITAKREIKRVSKRKQVQERARASERLCYYACLNFAVRAHYLCSVVSVLNVLYRVHLQNGDISQFPVLRFI